MSRRHNTIHAPSRGATRVLEVHGDIAPPEVFHEERTPEERARDAGWVKGQLLNVRNAGTDQASLYRVTLLGEEYDPTNAHRCLQFTNISEVQTFVSKWYSPEPGPRPFC